MNDYKTLKELTPSQKEKAEKITFIHLKIFINTLLMF
jgi:hypothetical protein